MSEVYVPEAPKKNLSTAELVYISVCAALMAVCSWISIPAPAPLAPFTLQTFAVFLILLLLGGRRGFFTVLAYILLGAVGLPVFAQFMGGAGVLLGTTGGYIVGFLFTALLTGVVADKTDRKLLPTVLAMAGGVLLCYAFGTAWFALVFMKNGEPKSLGAILSICVLPFLLPDAVKVALAAILTNRLKHVIMKGTEKRSKEDGSDENAA